MSAADRLAEIQARADAATEGPWEAEQDHVTEDGLTYTPSRVWTPGGLDPYGEVSSDYVLSYGGRK